MTDSKVYIAIDLKSFYASVECVERNLNPLKTNLVVADNSRTEKTICLAVSPSLKSFGVGGRPRLFELISTIKSVNYDRLKWAKKFVRKSYMYDELASNDKLEVDYIIAKPRMGHYIEYSNKIYRIYLKYIAPEDIHVYSIDEVFLDVTPYLKTYNKTPHELAITIIKDVLKNTGITATAGIGTNLYLAKVAMDILAKKMPADEDGVRIAELDEMSYRKLMWNHTPITDFWRVGKGYAKKLESVGLYTMGDIARCSLGSDDSEYNQELLFKLFGKNAELLIDHSWGYEPCTIKDIKEYKPEKRSMGSGQVLQEPYTNEKAKLITWEIVDNLVLDLVSKNLLTNQIVLYINYDKENLSDNNIKFKYKGEITRDSYGRRVPKPVRGTINLDDYSSSTSKILDAVMKLYEKITNDLLLIRKISISFNNLISQNDYEKIPKQLSLFEIENEGSESCDEENKEKTIQEVMLRIKGKYGKNSILKAKNLEEGATSRSRNKQIGGHRE